MRVWLISSLFILLLMGISACSLQPYPAERRSTATVPLPTFTATATLPAATATPFVPTPTSTQSLTQVMRGEKLFALYCHICHQEGKGIGPVLRPKVVYTYKSAAKFQRYIQKTMPYEAGGTLKEQQYWDIVAFILASREFVSTAIEIGPDNAETIILEKPE